MSLKLCVKPKFVVEISQMNIVAFYNSSKIEKKVAFFMFIVDLQLNKRVKNPLALITLKIISLKTW